MTSCRRIKLTYIWLDLAPGAKGIRGALSQRPAKCVAQYLCINGKLNAAQPRPSGTIIQNPLNHRKLDTLTRKSRPSTPNNPTLSNAVLSGRRNQDPLDELVTSDSDSNQEFSDHPIDQRQNVEARSHVQKKTVRLMAKGSARSSIPHIDLSQIRSRAKPKSSRAVQSEVRDLL